VCRRCYGSDLSTGTLVQRGAAVGVVAGQSIGEPGTQLSMRAFHSGGVAFAQGDIRAGLPRVIDLFEAHPPAHPAILARHQGRVTIRKEVCGETTITIVDEAGEMWSTRLPAGQKPAISDGQSVVIGTPLSGGTVNPHELLSLLGSLATARYLVAEVQQVFRGTGVYIADKHIECIARQMLRFVVVGDEGDTSLLPGAVVERSAFEQAVAETLAEGGHPATASPLLFGLTRAALHTTSWIAAASFQETSRVLTRAAIGGQCDDVQGFKSRLVIGRRIPECR